MALLIPSRKIIKTLLARKHEYGITRSYPSAIYRENITISWNNFFFSDKNVVNNTYFYYGTICLFQRLWNCL